MSHEEILEKMKRASVMEDADILLATYTIVIVNCQERTYSVQEPLLFTVGKAQYHDLSGIYRNQIDRIPVTIFE